MARQRTVVPLRKEQRQGREPIVYSSFRLEERGLTPVGTPTREQWSECLDYLMHLEKHIHFWIGDLLAYGERRWGEMYSEMIERTGYEPRTLRTLKWVASSVDVSRRREGLSFAHHQEAAGLSPEQQDVILDLSERGGWTREMVRHAINRLTYERERPHDVAVVPGLHHGDCRSVMVSLPNESIDLLVTDPPQESPEVLAVFDEALACAMSKLKPNSHVTGTSTRSSSLRTRGVATSTDGGTAMCGAATPSQSRSIQRKSPSRSCSTSSRSQRKRRRRSSIPS